MSDSFAQVGRRYYDDIIPKGLLILTTCLIIHSSAAPLVCKTRFNVNEVLLCGENGTFIVWQCPACQPGLGLSVECGRQYPLGTNVECVQCTKGHNYSDSNGIGQCRPCTKCQEHEEQSGHCEPDQDTIQCTCKPEYYRDTQTRDCKKCSWCCKDNTNEHVPECKNLEKKCSFHTSKSCSPTTPPTTFPTTTTSPTSSPRTPTTNPPLKEESVNIPSFGTIEPNDPKSTSKGSQKTEKDPNENGKKNEGSELVQTNIIYIIVSIVAVILLIIIVSLVICNCWKRNNTTGSNSCDSTDSRSRSSTTTSKDLSSSAQLLPPGDDEKGMSNNSNTGTSSINLNIKDHTARYAKEHEKASLLTEPDHERQGKKEVYKMSEETSESPSGSTSFQSSLIGCACAGSSSSSHDTHRDLTKEQKLEVFVIDLPLEILSKVCCRLDTEDPLNFCDYRLLAEKLSLCNDQIQRLRQKESEPTYFLLKTYKLKIQQCMQILKEIKREDVMEIIETWLNQ